MKYQSLEEYIATLSEREKNQYKYLIEECLQREVEIKRNHAEARKGLERLLADMRRLIKGVHALETSARKLEMDMSGRVFRDYPISFN